MEEWNYVAGPCTNQPLAAEFFPKLLANWNALRSDEIAGNLHTVRLVQDLEEESVPE